jgi:hypothetical protein
MTTPSPIAFETLWTNYPTSDPCIDPKTGSPPKGFSNQCAIRLGRALELSGVSFRSFHGGVCPCQNTHLEWRRVLSSLRTG